MRKSLSVLATCLVLPAAATAQVPEIRVISGTALAPALSLRPLPRPGAAPRPHTETPLGVTALDTPEPGTALAAEQPGPDREAPLAGLFRPRGDEPTAVIVGGGSALAVAGSIRPMLRPDGLEAGTRAAATRNIPGRVTQPGRNSGTLCGVVGLQGEEIEPVTGRINGCSIPNAVRLRAVHGVELSTPATINCTAAQSLSEWVLDAEEIIGNTGGGMASLTVLASYACRTRNSQRGARLSEHATGNAVDIGAIGLQDGSELSVRDEWNGRNSSIMRRLHEAACGTFGTVLGPDADRYHSNHFHLDVALYRSGAYCR